MNLALLILAAAAVAQNPSNQNPSVVLELSDRFLEVKDTGHWFIEFYAPWCGHCKRLAPVWEQAAHLLAEEQPEIRMAKLDATRFPSVASELGIHGFPSLKYFRNGAVMDYNGDRSKGAIVAFAHKAYGPEVRVIYPEARYFQQRYLEHYADGFFVLVSEDQESELAKEFGRVANELFVKTYFFSTKPKGLPENVTVSGNLPAIIAINAEGVQQFDPAGPHTLPAWVERRRWPLFPELSYGNLYDIGLCCDRLLVIVVSDLVQRNKRGSPTAKFEQLAAETARKHKADLDDGFQFVWSDGNEIPNNIVLGWLEIPALIVLNASSQEYSVPADSVHNMTADSLHLWLMAVGRGEVAKYGGKGFLQRLKRTGYDIYTTLYMMFSTQPLLSVCLFGLPTGILAIICYTLCSVDMSEETADVYRDEDEDDDLEDHEKRE